MANAGHIIRSKWDSLYKQAFWDIEKERKRFAHSSVRERERALCVYKSVICAEWSSIDHHHKRLHVLRERDVVTKGRLARERNKSRAK